MPTTLEAAETLSDLAVNNNDLKKEVSRLKKLITLGFEGENKGLEKVAKTLCSEDTEQIKKLYDNLGSVIKAIYLEGSFDQFASYLKINHSVYLDECTFAPQYIETPKKHQKYTSEFEQYFLEQPVNPEEDMKRIQSSLVANFKEIKIEADKYKEEFETQADGIPDTPEILKTITKILSQSKIKVQDLDDVVAKVEEALHSQEVALNLLSNKENNSEN